MRTITYKEKAAIIKAELSRALSRRLKATERQRDAAEKSYAVLGAGLRERRFDERAFSRFFIHEHELTLMIVEPFYGQCLSGFAPDKAAIHGSGSPSSWIRCPQVIT